jgi:hypothetical protein
MLLKKCTTPVRAMANSIGKNNAKTGIKIVPKPNPEKNVRIEVKNATRQIMKYSNKCKFKKAVSFETAFKF